MKRTLGEQNDELRALRVYVCFYSLRAQPRRNPRRNIPLSEGPTIPSLDSNTSMGSYFILLVEQVEACFITPSAQGNGTGGANGGAV